MASIQSVTQAAATENNSITPSKAQTQKNQFLQLLVAQLKGQNPLDPLDGTQFVSQLAEFSSLEELTNIHSGIDSIQSLLQPSTSSTNKGAFEQ